MKADRERASNRAPRVTNPAIWTARKPPAPISSTSKSQSIARTSRASTASATAAITPMSRKSACESVIVVLATITDAMLS